MRNFKLTLEYDGTAYHGFQIQQNGNTIQAEIERALHKLFLKPIRISSSGRTDTGVHAFGHVANFKVPTQLKPENILKALNRYLPEDVAVLKVEEVPLDFHAQYSAKSKIYEYRIYQSLIRSPLLSRTTYQCFYKLDANKMAKALRLLKGKHDFRSFASKTDKEKNTVRQMQQAKLIKKGNLITVRLEADGFLYNMVRNIVGTLLLVGSNRMSLAEFRRVFLSCNRKEAGPLVPPQGLTLLKVKY